MNLTEKEAIRWFGLRMGEMLTENANKWKKGPWTQVTFERSVGRLGEKLTDLEVELTTEPKDNEHVINECADIACIAMMIAHNSKEGK
jgi:phosphoribosyl-ATP pyrophosphohydrolase